jgi:hypothetical protein
VTYNPDNGVADNISNGALVVGCVFKYLCWKSPAVNSVNRQEQDMVPYNAVNFPSPVKAPLSINAMGFEDSCLQEQLVKHYVENETSGVTYISVKLPSPLNAPLVRDVIWFLNMCLQQHHA